MATGDPDSARALRPLRRLALPGGRTLLRAGLVAALLGLAAAVLHTPAGCPPTTRAARIPRPGPRRTGRRAAADRHERNHGRAAPDSAGPLPLPSGAVGVPVRLAEPAALAVAPPRSPGRSARGAAGRGGRRSRPRSAPRALVLDVLGAGATDGSSALDPGRSAPTRRNARSGCPRGAAARSSSAVDRAHRRARRRSRTPGRGAGSAPVRWAFGEQPVVVAAGPLAPAAVGVVGRLLGQHHEVFAQVDGAIVVAARALRAGVLGAHERQD